MIFCKRQRRSRAEVELTPDDLYLGPSDLQKVAPPSRQRSHPPCLTLVSLLRLNSCDTPPPCPPTAPPPSAAPPPCSPHRHLATVDLKVSLSASFLLHHLPAPTSPHPPFTFFPHPPSVFFFAPTTQCSFNHLACSHFHIK